MYEELIGRIEKLEAEVEALKRSNPLWGKKWFATGDSFTEGDFSGSAKQDFIFESGKYAGMKKVYPYFIGERNNMEVINDGKCGSILPMEKSYVSGETSDPDFCRPFTYERYKRIPSDVDYITLWFGINDSWHSALGKLSDRDNTTFYGGWNFILPYLIKNFPKAKLGVIVTNWGLPEYRQATRECCEKWGVPYLDMMGDARIPVSTGREAGMGLCAEAKELWYDRFKVKCLKGTNGHPSPEWHEFQSYYIEDFLRRI